MPEKSSNLSVLIQAHDSFLYFGKDGAWVENPKDALVFSDAFEARTYAKEKDLGSFEIVVHKTKVGKSG